MAWLIEPHPQRQRLVLPWLAVGTAVAPYMTWAVLGRPHSARIVNDHIAYVTGDRYVLFIAPPYLAAITAPLLLSAKRSLVTLGSIVLLGYLLTFVAYWMAFVSVWCFFAAAQRHHRVPFLPAGTRPHSDRRRLTALPLSGGTRRGGP